MAAWGVAVVGRPLTPDERLGLTLNRRLALGWAAAAAAIGAAVASGAKADLSLFEAVCETEAEAADAEWEHESKRLIARAGRAR